MTIVMVTPLEENGLSSCATYWPNLKVKEWYGDLSCECISISEENGYTCRRIKAKKVIKRGPYTFVHLRVLYVKAG